VRAGAPIGASVQHTLNLHFRPEGLGVIFAPAERSEVMQK